MNNNTPQETQNVNGPENLGNSQESGSTSFWQKQKILLKGGLIGFLVLMLLIPTFFISSLVQERANRSKEVKREIAAQWGKQQEIRGPVISIPYYELQKGADNKMRTVKSHAFFLPNKLNVTGNLEPEIRHRKIFKMVGYEANLNFTGSFEKLNFEKLKIPRESLLLNEAQVLFGLSDFQGIRDDLKFVWNGKEHTLNSGMPTNNLLRKGLSAPIQLTNESLNGKTDFKMSLILRGSEGLFFLPLGKTTKVKLQADWSNPSFEGNSPTSIVTDTSFKADWTLLSINREYPQEWTGDDNYNVSNSSFGVNLLQPINHYSKNERSVKYGILIILLTFVVYFFIEILQKKNAHAIQYVLVGFALCIFYTLLLSFSELVGFNWAYLISAGATVALLGTYTSSVFQSRKSGLIFTAFLSALYVFIFSLIQLQDRALLFGSIGLFIILAAVMYVSRKINWYNK